MHESERKGFETTQWSLVLAAGQEQGELHREAMSELCQRYWTPLYFYARKKLPDAHEAQDATQEFFARMIEGEKFKVADPNRGRFRTFLLTSLQNFLVNWHEHKTAKKRGGEWQQMAFDFGHAESHWKLRSGEASPESEFEWNWATTLLAQVIRRLEAEYLTQNKLKQFESFKPFLTDLGDAERYREVGEKLNMEPNAVKVAVHRMRKRLGQLLRDELRDTLEHEDDLEGEMNDLFEALTHKR